MKKIFALFTLLVIGIGNIYSQEINFSGSSETRFGQGEEGYRYFENLSNLNIYWEKFYIYLQYESSDPPEIGLPFQGIRKRWVEYADNDFSIQFGHIQTLWNRGLSLNLFDNQATDYDNTIDGVQLKYYGNTYFNSELIGGKGKIRNTYPSIQSERPNRNEKFTLYGGKIETMNWFQPLSVSLSYVWSEVNSPFNIFQPTGDIFDTLRIEQRTPGVTVSIITDWMDFYVENVYRSVLYHPQLYSYPGMGGVMDTLNFTGEKYTNSIYASLNINLPWFSIMGDLKKYSFDIKNPSLRDEFPIRPGRMAPFQNPPIVQKEYEWTLSSRHMHIIDFNDEVGYQLEFQSAPFDFLTLTVNYSASSRNAAWTDTSSSWITSYKRKNLSSAFLPSSEDEFMPFQEFIVGVEGYYNSLYYKFFFVKSSEVEKYTAATQQFMREYKNSHTNLAFPGEIEYSLNRHGISLKYEFQYYDERTDILRENGTGLITQSIYNRLLELKYSYSPLFSIGLVQEISSKKDTFAGNKKKWQGIQCIYNINTNNQLSLFLGSERGGLKCSSGICVEVPSIVNGARLSLNTRF